jgi:hypothetical protein
MKVNGNDVHIPKKALGAFAFVAVVFTAGWKLNDAYNDYENALEAVWRAHAETNERLCRIEQAVGIEPVAECDE